MVKFSYYCPIVWGTRVFDRTIDEPMRALGFMFDMKNELMRHGLKLYNRESDVTGVFILDSNNERVGWIVKEY